MYEYIKGIYTGINEEYIIIENNGIGYKILVSGSTISRLPKVNENVLIYLRQIVREDFIGLYGFFTKEERELFDILLTINGVGAKAALSLLSISSVVNLKYAIATGDEKTIIKAPGIGKKIAQRIILELKDKLDMNFEDSLETAIDTNEKNERVLNQALAALVSLGYSEKEAEKAIKIADKNETLENIIKACLKYLMN